MAKDLIQYPAEVAEFQAKKMSSRFIRNRIVHSFVQAWTYRRTLMVRAGWKRPGSPIGKKSPRKANPSYKRRTREPWSSADVKMLKQLAKGNTPTGVMTVKLQRPVAAIRSKAHREGISLKPVNQSPYKRRATRRR
ncbi:MULTISPECIES: hypothetical protein [unclassified Bradyrhizobium]|uniref:hypothetical protein n=1 Tax=unclassified Bradyrhizobium TaxID=2631580 RepID=UPI001FFB44AB|nr:MULTISPECIES: hypothetical protein [unclassified Bradyrhizobium]